MVTLIVFRGVQGLGAGAIGASVLVLAAATGALVDWSSVMQAVFKLAG
jgi:hypothetical protein